MPQTVVVLRGQEDGLPAPANVEVLPEPVAIWTMARGRLRPREASRLRMARACALHRRVSSSPGSFFSRDRNVSGCSNQSAIVSGLGKWNTGRLRGVRSRRFVK